MPKILDDITCIELAEGWAAASLAGRLFREVGAKVIKVEPEAGDKLRQEPPLLAAGLSYGFQLVNGGKNSIALDLNQPSSIEVIRKLCSQADILLVDSRFAEKYLPGFGYEQLKQDNERLIYSYTSPFGMTGPLSSWSGNDFTIQAMAGVMATTGFPGKEPFRTGPYFAEHVGAIFAAAAVLAALEYREKTGRGQLIDMALYDCMVGYLGTFLPGYYITGKAPQRQGNRHPIAAPWNTFQAKDGVVMICTSTEPQWQTLLKIIGRADLIGDERYLGNPNRCARIDEVEQVVIDWVSQRTMAEVCEELGSYNLPVGPIYTLGDLMQDQHFQARQLLAWVEDKELGRVPSSGVLFKMTSSPGEPCGMAPKLGASTDEVLAGLS